jgi:hypothetical protein
MLPALRSTDRSTDWAHKVILENLSQAVSRSSEARTSLQGSGTSVTL